MRFRHDHPEEEWCRELERAKDWVLEAHFEEQGQMAIDAAERLLALAHYLAGVACTECGGLGKRAYSDTATVPGGVGGQAITEGMCDECWGTGRTDVTGPNLRRLYREVKL